MLTEPFPTSQEPRIWLRSVPVIHCWVINQQTEGHKTTTILFCLQILWLSKSDRAQWTWLASVPRCLRTQLGQLQWLGERSVAEAGVIWRLPHSQVGYLGITQSLGSAGAVDWIIYIWPLHVATVSSSMAAAPENGHPKNFPRERGRSW